MILDINTVQEQLLFTTLRIECLDQKGTIFSIGTGFLLQRPIEEDKSKIYLVSNKHVLCAAHSIALTFTKDRKGTPNIGETKRIPVKDIRNHIMEHPDPNVDVAVLECTGLFLMEPDLFFKLVSYEMLADFSEKELSVAENVYFVGYPNNRYDETNY